MATTTEIKAGIYPGQRFEDYRAIEAMNASTLLWGRYSLAHLRAAIDGKMDRDSKALTMGRAFHVRVLEPELYRERVAIVGPCDATLKSGDRKGLACGKAGSVRMGQLSYCGTHAPEDHDDLDGMEVITQEESDNIEGMRASLMAHPIISQIRRRGGFETTVIGEVEGVMCKVRFDKLILDDRSIVIDLKKCRLGHARIGNIEKAIYEYGYYFRAAMYLDVLAAAGGPTDVPFLLAFCEEAEPWAVNVVNVADPNAKNDDGHSWLDIGRAEYRKLLAAYRKASESGAWPAYTDEDGNIDVRTSYPPAWVSKRHGDDIALMELEEQHAERHPDADIVF